MEVDADMVEEKLEEEEEEEEAEEEEEEEDEEEDEDNNSEKSNSPHLACGENTHTKDIHPFHDVSYIPALWL